MHSSPIHQESTAQKKKKKHDSNSRNGRQHGLLLAHTCRAHSKVAMQITTKRNIPSLLFPPDRRRRSAWAAASTSGGRSAADRSFLPRREAANDVRLPRD